MPSQGNTLQGSYLGRLESSLGSLWALLGARGVQSSLRRNTTTITHTTMRALTPAPAHKTEVPPGSDRIAEHTRFDPFKHYISSEPTRLRTKVNRGSNPGGLQRQSTQHIHTHRGPANTAPAHKSYEGPLIGARLKETHFGPTSNIKARKQHTCT